MSDFLGRLTGRVPSKPGKRQEEIYKKSILFEVINKNNNKLTEAFTMTIPPDSIEYTQKQRNSRKKTFGGVFEDDYGLDNLEIKISGNTGGVDSRTCYRSSLQDKEYTGKETALNFFDKIIKYKKNVDGEFADYELRYYDLSLIEINDVTEKQKYKLPTDSLGWVVSLDDYKMSRNKDKPLFWNYTVDLFVLSELGKARALKGIKPEIPKRKNLKDALLAVRSKMNDINTILGKIKSMESKMNEGFALADSFEGQLDSYLTQVSDIAQAPARAYRQTLRLATYPTAFAKKLFSSFKETVTSYQDLIVATPDLFEATGEQVYLETTDLMTQTISLMTTLVAFGKTKQAQIPEVLEITPLGADSSAKEEETKTIEIYGTRLEIATGSTTFEKLAVKNFNDPSLGRLIADFNQASDDDISAGDFIKIPVLSEMEVDNENRIFSLNDKEFMGIDIKLRKDFSVALSENGDYALAQGNTTLVQSVNLRLNEQLGKRVRLVLYGLRNQVGGPLTLRAPIVYLLANIVDTVVQDPRIKTIANISLKGEGDSLFVTFDIISTNSDITRFAGVL